MVQSTPSDPIRVASGLDDLNNWSHLGHFMMNQVDFIRKLNAKPKHLGCKKVRSIRISSYLTIHATKSFDIS